MKKFLSLAAFLVIMAVSSSQAQAQMWFVTNLSNQGGSGLRVAAGEFLVDIMPTFTKSTSNSLGLYADVYKGDWGVGISFADLMTSGAGPNNLYFQFAKEYTLVKGVAIGGAVNIVDYAFAAGGTYASGDIRLFQTYTTYLVFDI